MHDAEHTPTASPTPLYQHQHHDLLPHPDYITLTPTVAIWVQPYSILRQTGLSCHLYFLTSGHSDAQD